MDFSGRVRDLFCEGHRLGVVPNQQSLNAWLLGQLGPLLPAKGEYLRPKVRVSHLEAASEVFCLLTNDFFRDESFERAEHR